MKIVFMGDSLTYGYGVKRSKIWTKLIEEKTGYEIINCGISGDTTGGMLARFQREVIDEAPDIVHIMGGGNDLFCEAGMDTIQANIMSMTQQAMASGIMPVVGICPKLKKDKIKSPWDEFTDFSIVEEKYNKLDKWIEKYCTCFGVKLVNYDAGVKKLLGSEDTSDLYLDGLHLTEEGNSLLAEVFIGNMELL